MIKTITLSEDEVSQILLEWFNEDEPVETEFRTVEFKINYENKVHEQLVSLHSVTLSSDNNNGNFKRN